LRRTLAAGAALAAAIAGWAGSGAAGGEPGATSATRTFRFTYSVAVRHIPAGARRVSIWVPVPQSDKHQQVLDVAVHSPLKYAFGPPAFGSGIGVYLSNAEGIVANLTVSRITP